MANDEVIQPTSGEDDPQYDEQIRPQRLDDFPGQEALKNKLRISITAAKQRNEPLDHMLWSPQIRYYALMLQAEFPDRAIFYRYTLLPTQGTRADEYYHFEGNELITCSHHRVRLGIV